MQEFLYYDLDWCQCGNSLALCYLAVVMELPDSLWMDRKSEFGVIFLRCSPTFSPHYDRGEVSMAGNHGHNTRSGNRACFVPRVNSFAMKSFFYTGVKLWNSLPYNTQIITNKQAFKSEVKKVLWLKLIQTNEDIFLFY